jgi:hypothetical protein
MNQSETTQNSQQILKALEAEGLKIPADLDVALDPNAPHLIAEVEAEGMTMDGITFEESPEAFWRETIESRNQIDDQLAERRLEIYHKLMQDITEEEKSRLRIELGRIEDFLF